MSSHILPFPNRCLCAGLLLLSLVPSLWAEAPAVRPPNRLIHERSPYLRQHADNPVDWYPWGPEAFARAKAENKPIFLSIGYSTCHWCHVMARESFADAATARLLNDNFVCIKVDREERPDLDRVYLTYVEATTGSGGWPMSVWLTPDLQPFFGGTYFPPEDGNGRPGFKTVLARVTALWTQSHEKVLRQSAQKLAQLGASAKGSPAGELPLATLRAGAFNRLKASFDPAHGGFDAAPKFPLPVNLEFLLDVAATAPEAGRREQAQAMALATLRAMAAGGINDQLGGGFHRYATDAAWRVPHFEKMLYDQAQLANVYLTAWQLAPEPALRDTATATLGYIRQRLTDPAGGFYTAEDADSPREAAKSDKDQGTSDKKQEHAEGAFYVWTEAEIVRLLGADEARFFADAYGVLPAGNAAGELAGRNILHRARTDAELAVRFKLSEAVVRARLEAARASLLAARDRRPRPFRDDKIVTAWNGLALSAFARAAQVLDDPAWAETATQAAVFLRTNLFDPATGRLAHSWRAGGRDTHGFAEDYAFLIQGLLDLYEATFEVRWLEWAAQLQEKQDELFHDATAGGYFSDDGSDASVLLRLKQESDDAEPAASSIAVRNLARLASLLHRDDWFALARRTARAFGPQLKRNPQAMVQLLASAGWLDGSPQQILIQGERTAPATRRLLAEVRARYLPRRSLLLIDAANREFFNARVPLVAGLPDGKPDEATAYVCENFVCQMPTRDPAVLRKLLGPVKPAQR